MRTIIWLLAALTISACAAQGTNTGSIAIATFSAGSANALKNGRLIFLTGRDVEGAKLTAQHLPLRASCAACHNPNGSGGIHLTEGVVSADLRYKQLVGDLKHPYTIPLLERAISTGIDNEGARLSPVMPRWRMSPRDLHDVAEYVFTQLR